MRRVPFDRGPEDYDASTRRFATTYAEVNVACTSAGDLDGRG